jgi:hypothetical protein
MTDTHVEPLREDRLPNGQFKKGVYKGGPGFPHGKRRDLELALVDDVVRDWRKHGAKVLTRVREDDPSTYLRVVASLLPKDLNVNVNVDIDPAAITEKLQELVDRESGRTARLVSGHAEVADPAKPDGILPPRRL